MLVLVVGAIWYLERIQAHPMTSGNVQAINISPDASVASGASSSTQSIPTSTSGAGSAVAGSATSNPGSAPSGIKNTGGLPSGTAASAASIRAIAAADAKAGDQPAIEIADPTGFVNAPSNFTLKSLIGKKVILLDFWTYSCVNCIRTLPYLTAWYQKYQNDGLVVVGIHTPEFEFEKNISNVQSAAKQYGITYPVILDSNYGTWTAYGNLYWPHEYLIDIAGYIVHDHVGEGDYDATESAIQNLLAERASVLGPSAGASGSPVVPTGTVSVAPADLSGINSPETYFGANRNSLLANGNPMVNGVQNLSLPQSSDVTANMLYLGGTWNFQDEYATNQSTGATILYTYDSAKMYFVASAGPNAPAGGATVEVMQDGATISAADAGTDVVNGKVIITSSRLYNLVNNHNGSSKHTIQLKVDSPGLEAFTFTFG